MSRSPGQPLRVVVLGGGTAGWMAATLMAHHWRSQPAHIGPVQISVLESPEIGIVGVGEGSTPSLKGFFDTLGIAESEWMPRCHATYKSSIEFRGWSAAPGHTAYMHPFPSDLDDRSVPALFYAAGLRRHGLDMDGHPDRYFLNGVLARQRRAPVSPEHFPFRMAYGYHFDASEIGRFLRDWGVARGVVHIEGTMREVVQDESGDLIALRTTDGREIAGDFFVDSTGFRGLLLQQSLGVPFLSFADNLFNDSAVVVQTPRDAPTTECHTTATALSAGWVWRIPLAHRLGNGYVYSSRHIDDEAAELELRRHLRLGDDAPPLRRLKMKVGRVERPWVRNCLAVGLSQGFIEPLEATALHLVHETVERFVEAYTQGGFGDRLRDAYNARINARFEGVRDYIVAHYRMSSRRDTDYWRACSSTENLSPSLRTLLQTWFAGENLDEEVRRQDIGKYFSTASWHCLLGGYGAYPDPAQMRAPSDAERRFDIAKIDDFLRRCALNFAPHDEALAALQS
ncbi:MAG: tryptophan 7-halogenase [Xanthomonadales bacterium]|nr:tryptophan 7-halogenase [Xanthomonadales bacterium]